MGRYSLVPCCRIAALALILGIGLIPAVAHAQDRSSDDRLDRIERDLNMLQRQVYRGAPTASGAPMAGGGGNAADIEVRMERLEAQMRDLTGKVESVANGLDQLKQRVEQINSDIDVRFSELSGNAAAATAPARPGAPPARGDGGRYAAAPAGLMPPGTVVPPPGSGGGGLNPIFNTLSPPGSAPAAPPSAAPSADEPASTGSRLPRGSATEQFNYAFGLVKQADYPGAETALKAFIEAHPNDALAANAQYWLGQSYYARNKYQEAATAFAEGYRRFPKGSKAPEDLLYLGRSLAKSDQKKNACLALAQLDQAFPNASAAVKKSADGERKRLACS
ncbi:MAG TPA: tol-pal system protein YbgF [Stellaceae bacterium]|nr:tol-pal system protein YbgF [Stellaceae bacterium]